MRTLASLFSREVAKKVGDRSPLLRALLVVPVAASALVVALVIVVICVIFAIVITQNAGGCGTTVPVGTPAGTIRTEAQYVQYFESQGISANGAAGVVGNLKQESGLSAETPGGGLAQWLGGRWTLMVAWTTKQGFPGDSPNQSVATRGQLMWIVYDLRTSYATLLTELNSASDPGTAATMFETAYEVCSGVLGYLRVVPGSQCNDPQRRVNAAEALAAAGGNSVTVSLVTGGTCVAVGGAGGDPIPGFRPGRDDMGVDACANPGMPIFAPQQSVLVDFIANWFTADGHDQPLMLFRFNPPLAGTYRGDEYWYVAEQIIPATDQRGTVFQAGQQVAAYAATGSCVEIGWGSPTTNSRTLVPSDANPSRGALTPEAETFKTFSHIPWVGQSP